MAVRDVRNFNFLKKAIEQRYRFRNEPNNPNFKSFRGIPYEPSVNPNSIFGRIYGTFRELIRDKHLVLNQYLNISDASVLEKLYLNLKRDPNLKFLDVPASALSDQGYELSDEYYQNQPKDIADAQLAEQTPPAVSASGGGPAGGIPGMPAIPSISLPRMIRDFKIPHAPQTPKPEIAIANKGGVVTQVRNIKSPGWLKTFGSNTQIFAGKNLSRIGQGLWNMGKIGTGGLYNLGVRVGNGGLNAIEKISMPGGLGGGRGIGKLSKSSNKLALGLIGLLLFMVLIGGLIGGLPGTTPPGEAAPITGPTDLSTCLFTRSDQSPSSASFKSPVLLGYFQEVSAKSGVPATVLAGIARIESPGIVNQTDATLSSLGCATSETGAKGLMQVQPPGTTGYSQAGVALGAQYLGISVDQLNFCDLRQNIFLGAGVISAKVGGAWDPNKTYDKNYIDNVAEGYYGCLKYGAPPGSPCSDPRNIYSYGGDLYTGISQCKGASSGTVPPPPPGSPPTKEFALSCPINNEYNTCSHFDDPRDPCHCNPDPNVYISQQACKDSPPLKYGIDVGTKASTTAVIPFITYQGESTPQTMACQLIRAQGATCPADGCESQQILHFHCSTATGTPDIYLQYNHIKANSNYEKSIGTTLISGQSIGDVAYYQTGLRRLNIQLGVGGECSYGEENVKFCKRGGDYFTCPLKKDFIAD